MNISLNDELGDLKIIDEVEKGGLGKWIEMVYKVLKNKNCYKGSWLSNKIGDNISKLFIKIKYPSSTISNGNKVNPKESYYHFLSNRIVNFRNCTIGHGSSAYIPVDEELLYMYKIYLYLLIEIKINFNQLSLKKDVIWITYIGENLAFLDKLTPEINELRYIDYLSENSIPLFGER